MKRFKKTVMALAIMGLVMMVSCRKPNMANVVSGTPRTVTFNATTESDGGSKTVLDGVQVKWTEGDKISVNGSELTLAEGAGTTFGSFTGVVTGSNYLASYLATSNDGTTVTFNIPATQSDNTLDLSGKLPMAAYTDDGSSELAFKNMVNILKLNLTGEQTITKIELASETENLNGNFTVTSTLTPLAISGSETSQKTITVNYGTQLTSTPQTVYVVLPVFSSESSTVSIKFTGTDGEQTLSNTLPYSHIPNHKYNADVEVALEEVMYVDLGLESGLKWAKCNVGANSPEEYGDYFAWGEILPYYADGYSQEKPCTHWRSMTTGAGNSVNTTKGYHWYTYSQGGISNFAEWTTLPYTNNDYVLRPERDAAKANWGGSWRMPTLDDWYELYQSTSWTWCDNYNETRVNGYVVTGNKEGYTDKSIFLPAAGYHYETTINSINTWGQYWSSQLYSSTTNNANCMSFSSYKYYISKIDRYRGYSVRPVMP